MPVLIVDKPGGMTSFAVVGAVRGLLTVASRAPVQTLLRNLRVGHGGTLDPMASGVLPLLIGEGTKLADFFLDADKTYLAEVHLGIETDTLDAEGAVTARDPVERLDEGAIREALKKFAGPIEQIPPMYSALKKEGRPLYAYARAGETVERRPRQVTIFELQLLELVPPDRLRLRVRCSKGTYIRTLAADLGSALGCGAHLSALRRTATGPFRIEAAHTLAEVRAAAAGARGPETATGATGATGASGPEGRQEHRTAGAIRLLTLTEALEGQPMIVTDGDTARRLAMGQPVVFDTLGPGAENVPLGARAGVVGPDGELLAMVARDGRVDVQRAGTTRILRGFTSEAAVRLALGALFGAQPPPPAVETTG